MQAQTIEALRQVAKKGSLQAIKDAYNLWLVMIKWVIKSLMLFLNENGEVNTKELIMRRNLRS